MHPALSVILFTTTSGAGYGLMAWLGILGASGLLPESPVGTLVALVIALVLVTAGLLSSTFHLGHPERAWRAMSQWRSSWLSREGVAAVATYAPALIFGWLVWQGEDGAALRWIGLALVAASLATVWCTGMIYASLKTVPLWNQPMTGPVYIGFSLASGAVLANVYWAFSHPETAATFALCTVSLMLAAWVMKRAAWSSADSAPHRATAESATGLGRFGKVRPVEHPHTEANYIQREMGHKIARKHARKLRRIAIWIGCLLPVLMLLVQTSMPGSVAADWSVLVVIPAAIGLFVERWLFFAEAKHVVMLYYGESRI